MISDERITEVRHLLAEGKLSQRKIAIQTGVSRGTVSAVANGKRPDYKPKPPEDEFDLPPGPKGRCGECGGMVYMPCRLCLTRKRIAKEKPIRRIDTRPIEPLGLELRGECRRRYEAVRARRSELGEWYQEESDQGGTVHDGQPVT